MSAVTPPSKLNLRNFSGSDPLPVTSYSIERIPLIFFKLYFGENS